MSAATPPPPGPDDAIVTIGIDRSVPAGSPPDSNTTGGQDDLDPRGAGTRTVPSTDPVRPAIVIASVAITVFHIVLTLIGLASDADAVRNGVASASVVLFFVGALAFMVAFVLAAGRSRYEELWFGGVFFLTGGVVPARVRSTLMACLVVQSIVGLVGASLAPFTPVAFVVLVPLAAMGLMSLYGARWGEFSPKVEAD